jgi:ribosome-associated protein
MNSGWLLYRKQQVYAARRKIRRGGQTDRMIRITDTIVAIDDAEVDERFIRSSGPGGQHVNKVSTAVQLRFDIVNSPSLPDDVRERLIGLAGNRMTEDGILVIEARRFRSQEKNRQDAMRRLQKLMSQAAHRPKPRRSTTPTLASQCRRLSAKRLGGETKRLRRPVYDVEE